ncbi:MULTISPECIES: hypothetical protein [unclassified Paraburkholderia]|uniref:hypothetical protein n=1 Tax=unclassified Paraburkholderia TaxID=2615204 RepID=UPI001FBB0C22|nr:MULTISPECIES: hypothetical protein [unclassified Paraburkholderia]
MAGINAAVVDILIAALYDPCGPAQCIPGAISRWSSRPWSCSAGGEWPSWGGVLITAALAWWVV